jgi:hypothetical protein
MDSQTFDRLVADAARHPTRRATFRLLAGGLVAALIPNHAAAQRADRDGDGLYDDDEVNVYGTDPDVYDSDGDDVGDGEEIWNRDQGLDGPSDPLTPDGGVEAPPPDAPGEVPPAGTGMFLREMCVPGLDVCAAPYQCDAPTTRHTCSGTVAGVSAWCCVPPGGNCTECDCCGNYYCAFDDNNVATCQPNPEG